MPNRTAKIKAWQQLLPSKKRTSKTTPLWPKLSTKSFLSDIMASPNKSISYPPKKTSPTKKSASVSITPTPKTKLLVSKSPKANQISGIWTAWWSNVKEGFGTCWAFWQTKTNAELRKGGSWCRIWWKNTGRTNGKMIKTPPFRWMITFWDPIWSNK